MFFVILIIVVDKERVVNSINQSIYLLAIYLPICLYEVICPSFLKAVLSAETVLFIKTVCREIQILTKALYSSNFTVTKRIFEYYLVFSYFYSNCMILWGCVAKLMGLE